MRNNIWKKEMKQFPAAIFLYALAGFMILPVLWVLSGSIMSNYELAENLHAIIAKTEGFITWDWIPDYPTGKHYVNLLLYMPSFYVVFWNSVKLVFCILMGQLFLAVPAAWVFAVYSFRFRKALFSCYIVLMLMPFQVTMLSNYLVLDVLHMLDTHMAVILPAVFSTFPVFLIYRGFRALPEEILDAARVDGAGEGMIFLHIGLPLSSSGILSAMVLGFLEYWNLIEQPLAFLQNKTLWPLSLFLPEIGMEQAGYAFAASVITLIPVVFVFLLGRDFLERGIVTSALKE